MTIFRQGLPLLLAATFCGLAATTIENEAGAQTLDEIRRNRNTDHVLNFGMGYDLRMWSSLKQIDKSNVKRLVPVWRFSTMSNNGELSQPTVYEGVMYVVNADWTFAIDVATGRQIWRTPVNYDRGVLRIASTGAIMRGAATIYDGKVYRQTLDGFVVALDMKTGKAVWRTRFCEFKGPGRTKNGVRPLFRNVLTAPSVTSGPLLPTRNAA